MRWIVLAVALAGCGDVSPAGMAGSGGVGTSGMAGDAAGSTGSGGSGSGGTGAPAGGESGGGTAGTAGQAGSSGTAGTSGAGGAPMPNCLIPLEQISGTDPAAILNRTNGEPRCQNMTISVQIINGVYYDAAWVRTSYVISPSSDPPGMCVAQLRFERVSNTTCGVPQGTERLYVSLTVPAI